MMIIQITPFNGEPCRAPSRYPNRLTVVSLALMPSPDSSDMSFLGFSLLHVWRTLEAGQVAFKLTNQAAVGFEAGDAALLSEALAQGLRVDHQLIGIGLDVTLQIFVRHAIKTDPGGFAPAIIQINDCLRYTPLLQLQSLFGQLDFDERTAKRVVGAIVPYDSEAGRQAWLNGDSQGLITALILRNRLIWLCLVNFTLPVNEQLAAVMALKPG